MKTKLLLKTMILTTILGSCFLTSCEPSEKSIAYDEAVSYLQSEDYYKAYYAFKGLNRYKDSRKKLKQCSEKIEETEEKIIQNQYKQFENLETLGTDRIKFGLYEQDANIYDGKEEILWDIVEIRGNEVLLLTHFVLDNVQYNKEFEPVTWETSNLRSWLNNDFISIAFNNDKNNYIQTHEIVQQPNLSERYYADPGNNTQDKAFVLNAQELESYFPNPDDRKSNVTDYALHQGVYSSNLHATYWTRTIGGYPDPYTSACFCDFRGLIYDYGNKVTFDEYGVRPAIWVKYKD